MSTHGKPSKLILCIIISPMNISSQQLHKICWPLGKRNMMYAFVKSGIQAKGALLWRRTYHLWITNWWGLNAVRPLVGGPSSWPEDHITCLNNGVYGDWRWDGGKVLYVWTFTRCSHVCVHGPGLWPSTLVLILKYNKYINNFKSSPLYLYFTHVLYLEYLIYLQVHTCKYNEVVDVPMWGMA